MLVLVTGGGGYLGNVLARELLARGHRVRIFDRFSFGRTSLDELLNHSAVDIYEGDIRRLQEHPALLEGVDAVVHLASLSNDPTCALDPDMARDVNVASTFELARQAREHGVGRFLLGSSCAVYGQGLFDVLDEQSPANPVALLGQTKREAEQGLLALGGNGFEALVCRTATMFGWSPRMRFDLAINQMVATAVTQGRIEVRGGGNQWRPFIHVADAAHAMARLLEAPAEVVSGEIFNVGWDDFNARVVDLAHQIAGQIGRVKVEVAKDDPDLRDFRVSFHKLAETIGFAPQHDVAAGVAEVRDAMAREGITEPFSERYFNVARYRALRATPVDEGGEPIAAHFIPLARPNFGPEEEAAVVEALRSGWVTSGPHIKTFEQVFAKTVEAPHAVAASSCTAALHLCMAELGIGPGDEVVLSPVTWASVGNLVLMLGARPVFCDVEPDTLNLDPAQLEGCITQRTKAIVPVHLTGHACDLDAITDVAKRHGVPVIQDAAHALGGGYRGRPLGSHGHAACFSFYAIKNLTTIEGGTIALDNPERATRLHLLASNGMAATAFDRYSRSAQAAPPEVVAPGHKYALGNASAAIGVAQFKKFERFIAARRRIANMYNTVLAEVDEVETPAVRDYATPSWHLYMVRLRLDRLTANRDEIAYLLRRENIGTGVHFLALHTHQYYREALGYAPADAPIAAEQTRRILSLPLHPGLTDKEVHEVVSALKKVLHHTLRHR